MEIKGQQWDAKRCYETSLKSSKASIKQLQLGSTVDEPDNQQIHEIVLGPTKPDQVVRIRASLPDKIRSQIVAFLREKLNCFSWLHEDMMGIRLEVITHKLNANPNF